MLPQRMLTLEDHSIHQGWMVGQWKLLRNQRFFSSFRLAQFCAWGRIRPKCNGLDGNPLTQCEVHAPDRVSSSLSMLSQASVVWTYDWIFSGKGSSLPCAKAIFCRQSTVLISSICEYAIPCPQRFSILISSILFVKDLTAYGGNICLGGTCRPPVTSLYNVLAKGAHKASDTLRIFRWDFYVAVHEGVKKGIHCWKSDCTLT